MLTNTIHFHSWLSRCPIFAKKAENAPFCAKNQKISYLSWNFHYFHKKRGFCDFYDFLTSRVPPGWEGGLRGPAWDTLNHKRSVHCASKGDLGSGDPTCIACPRRWPGSACPTSAHIPVSWRQRMQRLPFRCSPSQAIRLPAKPSN